MPDDNDRPSLPPVRTRTRTIPPVTPTPRQEPPPPPPPDAATDDTLPDSRKEAEAPQAAAPTAGDFEVGYRKPPRHSRYKPGQSGNPKGRPSGARSLNTIVRKRMHETVSVKTANGIVRMPRNEGLFLKAMELGSQGKIRILERLFAMYLTANPEPQAISEPTGLVDPALLSAADKEILELLREEIAAELRAGSPAADVDGVDGEDDHA